MATNLEIAIAQTLAVIPQEAMSPTYTKARLNKAFKALRNRGYLARQAFSCCGSCAGYAIANEVDSWSPARQAKLVGAVYYHTQDADAVKLDRKQVGRLHIRYGQVEVNSDNGTTQTFGTKDRKAIGDEVAALLREHGLCVEWDGNPDTAIVVHGLDQMVIDAACATVRLGGSYEDVLADRASGK